MSSLLRARLNKLERSIPAPEKRRRVISVVAGEETNLERINCWMRKATIPKPETWPSSATSWFPQARRPIPSRLTSIEARATFPQMKNNRASHFVV